MFVRRAHAPVGRILGSVRELTVDATELVKKLVRHGACVEIYNGMGQTAHQVAFEAGHVHVVEFLEECQPREERGRDLIPSVVQVRTKTSTESDPRTADWVCRECGASVFASRKACFQCSAPRPVRRPEDEYVTGVSPFATQLLREMRRPDDDEG
jgi:hypothetical protein